MVEAVERLEGSLLLDSLTSVPGGCLASLRSLSLRSAREGNGLYVEGGVACGADLEEPTAPPDDLNFPARTVLLLVANNCAIGGDKEFKMDQRKTYKIYGFISLPDS